MSDSFILPLRTKIAAGLVTSVLVAIVAAISFWTVSRAERSSEEVDHTSQVLLEQQKVLAGLADAETSARGFVLTGDSSFLTPLAAAHAGVPASIARLRALTSDPAQQARLDTLESVAMLQLQLNDQIARFRGTDGFRLASDLIRSGQGKLVMDHARAVTAAMEMEESRLLRIRTVRQEKNQRLAYLVIGIGGALAFILSLLIMWSIRADVIERELQRSVIEKQTRQLKRQAEKLESALRDARVAQQEQGRLARQMTALLESTEAGFHGMDPNGNCTFINRAGAAMLGYAVDELIGKDLHMTVHHHHPDGTPYPAEDCPIRQASRTGSSAASEHEVFWRKDGSPLSVEYSSSPIIADGEHRGAVVAFADITARKKAEAERNQLMKALARSNQELDQFAYVASHDLKAPLRGIANLSQWIEEDLGERLGGENKSQMEMLRGRVHRMEALIDGILQYSRAGRAKARPEDIDTGALVKDVVELIAPPKETKVQIATDMPTVSAERIPLQQVFMNLIGNAMKHTGNVNPLIEIGWSDAGLFYEFLVRDNGQGIAPQYHERIFGIFQTLEARDKVEGTGIGLSVVQKIVEARGGRVWVESEVGKGARFKFLWPKAKSRERV
ncbi:MAG: CHASE3 domain-containing protein [Gemmatimonadaceae bacterium]|nr:CHASE3 domain-containing protein [Gemmatimonadaceae bacterium]